MSILEAIDKIDLRTRIEMLRLNLVKRLIAGSQERIHEITELGSSQAERQIRVHAVDELVIASKHIDESIYQLEKFLIELKGEP